MMIYQLKCEGPRQYLDGYGKIFSQDVFKTIKEAEEHIPKFKELCTTPMADCDLEVLSGKQMRVKILELLLHE